MKKQIWFRRMGLFYFPAHPAGYFITLLAIVFMIPVITAVTKNGHSVSDDLYHLFVYGTCTAFWWKWVAEKTS